jgi:hypothetical protein
MRDTWLHNVKTLDYWANEFESLIRRDAPVSNPRIRSLKLRAQSLMRDMRNHVNKSESHEIDPAMAEQYNRYFRELIGIVEKIGFRKQQSKKASGSKGKRGQAGLRALALSQYRERGGSAQIFAKAFAAAHPGCTWSTVKKWIARSK